VNNLDKGLYFGNRQGRKIGAKGIQGRTYCGAEFESKINKSGLRSSQDRGDALVDNAAVQHGRIDPDTCGVVLRGGLQNAEVAW
jgi:hypothetical protein